MQTEFENLKQLIGEIRTTNGAAKYQQYYWPAASYCYAYEPEVMDGEELAPQFKAHNWYLPANGELARQYWYYRQGLASDLNIFATAINNSIMTNFTSSYRWSSSEYYQYVAWYINFSNGYFCYYNKYGSFVVRAVCAFDSLRGVLSTPSQKTSLEELTDEELAAEFKKRGYEGTLTMTKTVKI